MGSLNFSPVSETGPAKKQRPEIKKEEKTDIIILTNSIYYFIQHVYITKLNRSYRLIAYHQGHILWDYVYASLRGAKIAFSKLFNHKLWDKKAKPNWSPLYTPETQWYEKFTPKTPPAQSPRGET